MNEALAKKYATIAHRMQYAQFQISVEYSRILHAPDLVEYFRAHDTLKGAIPKSYDATQSILEFLILDDIGDVRELSRGMIAEKIHEMRQRRGSAVSRA